MWGICVESFLEKMNSGAESSHSAGAVMGCGACLPRCGRADTKQTEKIALRVRAKSYLGRRAVWV